MRTIACYAFPIADANQGMDMLSTLDTTSIDSYMLDYENKRVVVELADADTAAQHLAVAGHPVSGRMITLTDKEWPQSDGRDVDPSDDEIDYDPREEYCLGPAPRYA